MTENTILQLDPLAPRIEEALLLTGMSQSRFGYLAAGDPALVKKMHEGRRFRPRLAAKIEAFLESLNV